MLAFLALSSERIMHLHDFDIAAVESCGQVTVPQDEWSE